MQIQDLSKELDTEALSAVHGGNNGAAGTNTIGQLMGLTVPSVVGVLGTANTNIDVHGEQNANIVSYQDAGDSFLALLPVFLRK
jgi:hypothetical protein